jgi:hypothetical protein
MKACLVFAVAALILSACKTPQSFETMSNEELYAYNSSVEFPDRVYCRVEAQTGSYIRKRVCTRISKMFAGRIVSLDIPSSSRSIVYGW